MNEITQLDILVFAPHPDDAEVGMGGSIAKWIAEGKRVGVVDLTRGELGTKGDAEIRALEAEAATAVLGLHFKLNLDLGDGHIADSDANRVKVIDVIRETKANYLFTTPPYDRHPDHRAASDLVSNAFFLARLPKYKTRHDAHSPRRCFYYFIHDAREITFAVDISGYMEKKREALRAYRSQFVNPALPDGYRYAGIQDYLTQVEASNRTTGTRVGVNYAEGFYSSVPVLYEDMKTVG